MTLKAGRSTTDCDDRYAQRPLAQGTYTNGMPAHYNASELSSPECVALGRG